VVVTTKDLIRLIQCPRRWKTDPSWSEEHIEDNRLALRRLVLETELKDRRTTLTHLAKIWDSIYWCDKDWSRKSVTTSVNTMVSGMKLVSKMPTRLSAHSPSEFDFWIDSTCLKSSAEFILCDNENGVIQIWVFGNPSEIMRSPLPLAEAMLVEKKFFGIPKIKVIVFNILSGMNPKIIGLREFKNREATTILTLLTLAERAEFPSAGIHCEGCKIDCWK